MAGNPITLDDPNPRIKRAMNDRLLYLGAFAVALLLIAVMYGIRTRVMAKQAREQKQTQAQLASGPATSNRKDVQSGSNTSKTTPPKSEAVTHPEIVVQPAQYQQPEPLSPEEQALLDEEKRQRDLEIQARAAPTGLHLNQGSASSSGTPPVYPAPPIAPGTPANSGMASSEYKAQNDQDQKARFASEREPLNPADDYLNATQVGAISPFVVRAGWNIPASLMERLVSDLPGSLPAIVRANVMDTATGKYIMIPAGSRLNGEYNSNVSPGQDRVQVAWTRIIFPPSKDFPDGSSLDLGSMPAHAADGATGLHDQVDNHLKKVAAAVLISSLLTAGFQVSQNRSRDNVFAYPSTTQVVAGALGQQAQQVGSQMLQRSMNIQPTIKVRPGQIFLVHVSKDIVFAGPYQPIRIQ